MKLGSKLSLRDCIGQVQGLRMPVSLFAYMRSARLIVSRRRGLDLRYLSE